MSDGLRIWASDIYVRPLTVTLALFSLIVLVVFMSYVLVRELRLKLSTGKSLCKPG